MGILVRLDNTFMDLARGHLTEESMVPQSQNSSILTDRPFQEAQQSSLVRSIWSDMLSQFRWLHMFRLPSRFNLHARLAQKLPGLAVLQTLNLALQHRAVTVPADEALCVGLHMGVPPDRPLLCEYTNEKGKERLLEDHTCELWRFIDTESGGIPIGMFTIGYSKLQRSGFRWASSSFLEITEGSNWL